MSQHTSNSDTEPIKETAEERAARQRRNDLAKVWVFMLVFMALFGIVLYFYLTAPGINEAPDDTGFEPDTTAATI